MALLIRINLFLFALFLLVYAALLLRSPPTSSPSIIPRRYYYAFLDSCQPKVISSNKKTEEKNYDGGPGSGPIDNDPKLIRIKREKPAFVDTILLSKILNNHKKKKIVLTVNMEDEDLTEWEQQLGAEMRRIEYDKVSNLFEWKHLFPEWIDEEQENEGGYLCPEIPMPAANFEEDKDKGGYYYYYYFDFIMAKIPCGWNRDVFRLQVHLVAAKMAVLLSSRGGRGRPHPARVVVLSKCRPMMEIFRCDDLVSKEGDWWLFEPEMGRLEHKLSLPIGSCNLALPLWPEEEEDDERIKHQHQQSKDDERIKHQHQQSKDDERIKHQHQQSKDDERIKHQHQQSKDDERIKHQHQQSKDDERIKHQHQQSKDDERIKHQQSVMNMINRGGTDHEDQEAYATVLHSSEAYVCGAITLAQSLIQSGTKRDLVLLLDSSSISVPKREALVRAGWKIHPIERIRNPKAKKDSYNEYNYSKFRLWQLTQYSKLVFVDADIIVLKNLDHLFQFPEMSAAGNDGSLFNSGVMVIEPSRCTFRALMKARNHVSSYNGGDQGFLNEMFVYWHRLPRRVNFLKNLWSNSSGEAHLKNSLFGSDPPKLYAIHYLGLKPWQCYRDYDCNFDIEDQVVYASDVAHKRWWKVHDGMDEQLQRFCGLSAQRKNDLKWDRMNAMRKALPGAHWNITLTDPRRLTTTT